MVDGDQGEDVRVRQRGEAERQVVRRVCNLPRTATVRRAGDRQTRTQAARCAGVCLCVCVVCACVCMCVCVRVCVCVKASEGERRSSEAAKVRGEGAACLQRQV